MVTFKLSLKTAIFPDLRRGSAEIVFGYFVLIWWQTDKNNKLKQRCKDLFIWTELPVVLLIIGSDIIF